MDATEKRNALRGGAKLKETVSDDVSAFDEPSADEPEPVIRLEDDGTVVIRLTKPLAPHNGKGEDPLKDLQVIRLRQMYAGDMAVLDDEKGDISKVLLLARRLSGLPSIAIERLHADDFAHVHGIVQGKLGKFLGTSRPLWALSLA